MADLDAQVIDALRFRRAGVDQRVARRSVGGRTQFEGVQAEEELRHGRDADALVKGLLKTVAGIHTRTLYPKRQMRSTGKDRQLTGIKVISVSACFPGAG